MKDYLVLKTVTRLLAPFILMFAFYVQMHGEYSPGGGFQAGVILAAVFILYALIYGTSCVEKVISRLALIRCACAGILIYSGTGLVSLVRGGNYLNYSALSANPTSGQKLGIMVIEAGVGLTVFAVMLLIFVVFSTRRGD